MLIPLSALIVLGAVVMFFRAVDSGQFEDLERQGRATLFEEQLFEEQLFEEQLFEDPPPDDLHSERKLEEESHDDSFDRHSVQTH